VAIDGPDPGDHGRHWTEQPPQDVDLVDPVTICATYAGFALLSGLTLFQLRDA
jgi:hypothetical protein